MKRKNLIIILLAVLLIIGCSIFILKGKCNSNNSNNSENNNNESSNNIEEYVDALMKNMTIEERIAQMLVLYYASDHVDDNLITTLKNNAPGGFILIKENITTYEKTKRFVADLQKNSKIPLIISIDQEGGSVQRLEYLSDVTPTHIPYMYDVGLKGDETIAYNIGTLMAEELRTIGVNVTYAPVVDIYSNPNNKVIGKRSFGSSPDLVSKLSTSLAKGLEDNGIIATYKHFPGHGDPETDSHKSLPIINKTYEDLENIELKPFMEAINNNAKLMMVGHIALPNITGDNSPATLSKTIVTDILKDKLHYQGLVITDALNMGALTNNYSTEEIITKSINAGCDLLLMPSSSKKSIEIIKNNISEERINESVRKILIFKYTYLNKDNLLDKSYLGSVEHKNIVKDIS